GLVAEHLPTGVYPADATDEALEVISQVYAATERAEDVLDASLLNFDPALHAPLVLMNAGSIEKLPDFDIHTQGNPPSVVRVSLALDAERIALRRALGYTGHDWPPAAPRPTGARLAARRPLLAARRDVLRRPHRGAHGNAVGVAGEDRLPPSLRG